MTDQNDGTTGDETAGAEGTEGSPEQKPSNEQDPLALARKRQAGAEAARQEAARQLAEAQARLAKYEAAERDADGQKAADIATLQAEKAALEKRLADSEIEKTKAVLDVKYPNARAKLPEIIDEVRLAEFEALFAEDGGTEPPQPQRPNENNSGSAAAAKPAEETSEDIKARLKAMKPDWT